MMFYLAGSSRLDIAYAVFKGLRFSHNSRESHEVGVKHIVRCLQGTKTKGIVMIPDKYNLRIELYVNADFAGIYTSEDKTDPISVKGRTGILLTFGNIPIFWISKLQPEIVLSTLEAEYIALSQGMR